MIVLHDHIFWGHIYAFLANLNIFLWPPLAIIIGHEMAHAVLGHIPEKLTLTGQLCTTGVAGAPGSGVGHVTQ